MTSAETPKMTPEDLYELVSSLDFDKPRREVQNIALLMPLTSVLGLLNISFAEYWAAIRKEKPYLPVLKTLATFLGPESKPVSKSAFVRLMRPVSNYVELCDRLVSTFEHDYIWQAEVQWKSLLCGGFFASVEAKVFWLKFVDDATVLNAEKLSLEAGFCDLTHAYSQDPLIERFGCEAMRSVLNKRLKEPLEISNEELDPVFRRVRSADFIAVLMRLFAWQVAEMVVHNWDMYVREGMENDVPLESIMSLHENDDPLTVALQRMASHSGWRGGSRPNAITFLGKLWADADCQKLEEATSRQKLLNNWIGMRKGRPTFKMLLSLTKAVTAADPTKRGFEENQLSTYSWHQAVILRIAETLSRLSQDFLRIGFSGEQLASIGDAYRAEYRTARQILGKPLKEAAATAS